MSEVVVFRLLLGPTLSRLDALFTILSQLGLFDTYVMHWPHPPAFAGLPRGSAWVCLSNHLLNFRRYSVVKELAGL
jgi:hypothetical protein